MQAGVCGGGEGELGEGGLICTYGISTASLPFNCYYATKFLYT